MSAAVAIAAMAGFGMAFLASISPTGPIAVLVLQRSVRREYGAAFALGVGGALAEAGYATLAVFGLGVLFERVPTLEVVARAGAAVILLALGIRFLRFQQPAPAAAAPPVYDGGAARRAFAIGFGISAANPVLLITWSTSVAMLYGLAGVRLDGGARMVFPLAVGAGIVAALSLSIALVRRFSARLTVGLSTSAIRGAGALLIVVGLVSGVVVAARGWLS